MILVSELLQLQVMIHQLNPVYRFNDKQPNNVTVQWKYKSSSLRYALNFGIPTVRLSHHASTRETTSQEKEDKDIKDPLWNKSAVQK